TAIVLGLAVTAARTRTAGAGVVAAATAVAAIIAAMTAVAATSIGLNGASQNRRRKEGGDGERRGYENEPQLRCIRRGPLKRHFQCRHLLAGGTFDLDHPAPARAGA